MLKVQGRYGLQPNVTYFTRGRRRRGFTRRSGRRESERAQEFSAEKPGCWEI
jgi:hypothetical protein